MLITLATEWNGQMPWKTQLAKGTQAEGENGNSPIFTKQIEFVIINFLPKETPDSHGFLREPIK